MPFASLGAGDRIRILLQLVGGPKYVTEVKTASGATKTLGTSTRFAGNEAIIAAKKSFAYQQAIFTLRRYAFYTTLALSGLAIAAIKMGFDFDSSMQNARVAFQGFLPNVQAVNKELHFLYVYAALTPFEFPDVTQAARRLLPFIGNLQETNNVVKALGDSLAAAGTPTSQALTRATLQIQHLANTGRLTGQILLNLARDNIPMMMALQKHFNATGATIRDAISRGAIDAHTAIQALIEYTQTAPGYVGKAVQFSQKTFSGAFTTFKDLIRMAFGSSEQGLFKEATKRLVGINNALLPMIEGQRPMTITNLARALDNALSPSTHIIINLFSTLSEILKVVVSDFKILFVIINWFVRGLNYLTGAFGGTNRSATTFGYILGHIIFLAIVGAAMIEALKLAVLAYRAVQISLIAIGTAVNIVWLIWNGELLISIESTWGLMVALSTLRTFMLTKLIPTIIETGVALLANPLFWIPALIIAIVAGLTILYFKWKWFHDLVNSTARLIWDHWKLVTAALILVMGPLGLFSAAILVVARNWQFFKNIIMDVYNALRWVYDIMIKIANLNPIKHANWKRKLLGAAAIAGGPLFAPAVLGVGALAGHFAAGGYSTGGLALVGENGPEIVHLPMGSRVQPSPNATGVVSAQAAEGQPIVIHLMLNRKVLETAVVDLQQRRNARS